jgi:plasmid stability protein
MTILNVRGLDAELLAALKARAAAEGKSVNALVLRFIGRGLESQRPGIALRRHSDLDALAGCWTEEDAAEFERVTAPFR